MTGSSTLVLGGGGGGGGSASITISNFADRVLARAGKNRSGNYRISDIQRAFSQLTGRSITLKGLPSGSISAQPASSGGKRGQTASANAIVVQSVRQTVRVTTDSSRVRARGGRDFVLD